MRNILQIRNNLRQELFNPLPINNLKLSYVIIFALLSKNIPSITSRPYRTRFHYSMTGIWPCEKTQTTFSVHASRRTRSVAVGVVYLWHKQGAGVDDVNEVSQTPEEGTLRKDQTCFDPRSFSAGLSRSGSQPCVLMLVTSFHFKWKEQRWRLLTPEGSSCLPDRPLPSSFHLDIQPSISAETQ